MAQAGQLKTALEQRGIGTLQCIPGLDAENTVKQLRAGKLDVAWVRMLPGLDRAGLETVGEAGKEYVHLVAPADSALHTFRDLAGKRIGVGAAGSASEQSARAAFDFFNFGDAVELISGADTDLEHAFRDGTIQAAWVLAPLHEPGLEKLLAMGWCSLLPMPEAAALMRSVPGFAVEDWPVGLYGRDRTLPNAKDGPFQVVSVAVALLALPSQTPAIRRLFEPVADAAGVTLPEPPVSRPLPLPQTSRFPAVPILGCLLLAAAFAGGLRSLASRRVVRQRLVVGKWAEILANIDMELADAGTISALAGLEDRLQALRAQAEQTWLAGAVDANHLEVFYSMAHLREMRLYAQQERLSSQVVERPFAAYPATDFPGFETSEVFVEEPQRPFEEPVEQPLQSVSEPPRRPAVTIRITPDEQVIDMRQAADADSGQLDLF
jgi:hypothetical protein